MTAPLLGLAGVALWAVVQWRPGWVTRANVGTVLSIAGVYALAAWAGTHQ